MTPNFDHGWHGWGNVTLHPNDLEKMRMGEWGEGGNVTLQPNDEVTPNLDRGWRRWR